MTGNSLMRAVFLDRDGTLIEEAGYLERLDRLIFFPYSVDAVRQLNRAGFLVVVITNQADIARGIVTDEFLSIAHEHISRRLQAGGARVNAYYHCPHHPRGIVEALRTAFRKEFAARLAAAEAPQGLAECTPGIDAPRRLQQAREDAVAACDGFLRREAIRT